MRRGDIPDIDQPLDTRYEVKLHVPALIPEDYLPDIRRDWCLQAYRPSEQRRQLREIQVEMIDRFGLLPEPVKNLFTAALIKVRASSSALVKSI